ncbi:glutathione S-transferase family protein [Vineibacter terrae]|uniref:glutathione transferase n=1 Tax=Vineibacter terrae TaxID=2586908 RepID=A0A5C8P835_9HYPH|nr:glutathione S-transferase family protein [Vineibacter terrae]TXL69551.1 glutathione S-transferase family protein [Vineibacter terrae]
MSGFVVHSAAGSPFGRSVLVTLEEKHAAWRLAPVAVGTLRTPAHLARHPFGRIPVLEHDGFMLYETQAILRYLDRVLPTPSLTPADPRAAARMDQVMNVSDWYLFNGVGNIIGFQRIIRPRLMGQPADEAAIADVLPKAHVVIDELARLLGDSPYFAGTAPSLADLLVAPQIDFLTMTPEWAALGAHHRNLSAWLARMAERPSLQATTWERVAELAKAA